MTGRRFTVHILFVHWVPALRKMLESEIFVCGCLCLSSLAPLIIMMLILLLSETGIIPWESCLNTYLHDLRNFWLSWGYFIVSSLMGSNFCFVLVQHQICVFVTNKERLKRNWLKETPTISYTFICSINTKLNALKLLVL